MPARFERAKEKEKEEQTTLHFDLLLFQLRRGREGEEGRGGEWGRARWKEN